MSVDPTDDLTFWMTGQHNAAANWSTRIGALRLQPAPPVPAPAPTPMPQAPTAIANDASRAARPDIDVRLDELEEKVDEVLKRSPTAP